MKLRTLLLSILLASTLWFSSPCESGYYWMKNPRLGSIIVYYDSVLNIVKIWNPIKQEGSNVELGKISPEYRFQGPLLPEVNGANGNKL